MAISSILDQQQMREINNFFSNELLTRSSDWKDLHHTLVLALPPEDLAKVVYATMNESTLTLFTDTPAWTARIRFYDHEIIKVFKNQKDVKLRNVQVRTVPGASRQPGK